MSFWDFIRFADVHKLNRADRWIGFRKDWYDGPIYELGLWWWSFNSLGYDYQQARSSFDAGRKDGYEAGRKAGRNERPEIADTTKHEE
jgi:hypothetical protein